MQLKANSTLSNSSEAAVALTSSQVPARFSVAVHFDGRKRERERFSSWSRTPDLIAKDERLTNATYAVAFVSRSSLAVLSQLPRSAFFEVIFSIGLLPDLEVEDVEVDCRHCEWTPTSSQHMLT